MRITCPDEFFARSARAILSACGVAAVMTLNVLEAGAVGPRRVSRIEVADADGVEAVAVLTRFKLMGAATA